MFLIRLDDACEYCDRENWKRMELLLDKYNIKPIFGIIPHCEDTELTEKYAFDASFWENCDRWIQKGWIPALHGYNHVYSTECGGINPIHNRSEFAGLSIEEQQWKIERGVKILKEHKIAPEIFFAPSHTFDMNTLNALKNKSDIRIISDTVACDVYRKFGFYFIPLQAGSVRRLPFRIVTFCYHPNTMKDRDFDTLETFIISNINHFGTFSSNVLYERNFSLADRAVTILYMLQRKVRGLK